MKTALFLRIASVISLLFGAVYFLVGALGGLVWIFSAESSINRKA